MIVDQPLTATPIDERRMEMKMKNGFTGEVRAFDETMDVRLWERVPEPIKTDEVKLSYQSFWRVIEVREKLFDKDLALWNSIQAAMGRPLSNRTARLW